jgi:hypothetical protein
VPALQELAPSGTGYIYSLSSDVADSEIFFGGKHDTDESASNLSFRLPHFSVLNRNFAPFLWEKRHGAAKTDGNGLKTA